MGGRCDEKTRRRPAQAFLFGFFCCKETFRLVYILSCTRLPTSLFTLRATLLFSVNAAYELCFGFWFWYSRLEFVRRRRRCRLWWEKRERETPNVYYEPFVSLLVCCCCCLVIVWVEGG